MIHKAQLAGWLAPRGLAFNEDKTRVVTLDEGFDFLGFNVRRYANKPLIKPSKAAVRRIRERLRTELWSLRGTNTRAVLKELEARRIPTLGWSSFDGAWGRVGAGPRTTGPLGPLFRREDAATVQVSDLANA